MKNQSYETELLDIASKHFGVKTLELRGNDNLDFRDCYVPAIKWALEEAYLAGQKSRK